MGIPKVAELLGVGTGTVQRVKREMARQLAEGRDAQDAASQTSSPSSQKRDLKSPTLSPHTCDDRPDYGGRSATVSRGMAAETRNPRLYLCRRATPDPAGSFPNVLFKGCLFAAHRRTQTVRPNRLRLAKLETEPNCARGSPATTAQIRSGGFSFANPIVKGNHLLGLRCVSLWSEPEDGHAPNIAQRTYERSFGRLSPSLPASQREDDNQHEAENPPTPHRIGCHQVSRNGRSR